MNIFQFSLPPQHHNRMSLLGYWILSLIICAVFNNISLVIVIVWAFVGYQVVVKPAAWFQLKMQQWIIQNFFNGFDIFTAFYQGFELGRIVRLIFKLFFFLKLYVVAYISLSFWIN